MLQFIINIFLDLTPLWFGFLLLFIPLLYIQKLNLTTVYYMANIVFIIGIILLIISHIGTIPHLDLYNLLPVYLNNNTYLVSLIIPAITIANLYPLIYIEHEFYEPKYIVIGFILGMICNIATFVTTLGILGVFLTNLYAFPDYMALMRMNFFFIERFEFIMLMTLIFNFIILISFHLFFIRKQLFKKL